MTERRCYGATHVGSSWSALGYYRSIRLGSKKSEKCSRYPVNAWYKRGVADRDGTPVEAVTRLLGHPVDACLFCGRVVPSSREKFCKKRDLLRTAILKYRLSSSSSLQMVLASPSFIFCLAV
jgi:hypothetical protein